MVFGPLSVAAAFLFAVQDHPPPTSVSQLNIDNDNERCVVGGGDGVIRPQQRIHDSHGGSGGTQFGRSGVTVILTVAAPSPPGPVNLSYASF